MQDCFSPFGKAPETPHTSAPPSGTAPSAGSPFPSAPSHRTKPEPPPLPLREKAAAACYSLVGLSLGAVLCMQLFLPSLLLLPFSLFRREAPLWWRYAVSALSLYGAGIPLFAFLTHREALPPAARPSPKRMSGKDLASAFLLCFPLLNLGILFGNTLEALFLLLFPGSGGTILDDTARMGILPTFLYVVILAPFFEELLFRKLLLDRTGKYGQPAAVCLSAITFAIFHGNVSQFFYALFLGAFFAFLYLRTGSLRCTVLLHMAVNLFGSVFPLLLQILQTFLLRQFQGSSDATALFYFAGMYALTAVGTVLLIVHHRRFTLPMLPDEVDRAHAEKMLFSPGVIFFVVLGAAYFLLSLF